LTGIAVETLAGLAFRSLEPTPIKSEVPHRLTDHKPQANKRIMLRTHCNVVASVLYQSLVGYHRASAALLWLPQYKQTSKSTKQRALRGDIKPPNIWLSHLTFTPTSSRSSAQCRPWLSSTLSTPFTTPPLCVSLILFSPQSPIQDVSSFFLRPDSRRVACEALQVGEHVHEGHTARESRVIPFGGLPDQVFISVSILPLLCFAIPIQ
jgi:hypothetical protein